jgi:hypothetical protein
MIKKTRKARIEILTTDEEKVRIRKAAAEARLTLTDYCLNMILKGQVIASITPEQLSLQRSIAGMAANLNQVVKRMHQEKAIPAADIVMDTVKRLETILP